MVQPSSSLQADEYGNGLSIKSVFSLDRTATNVVVSGKKKGLEYISELFTNAVLGLQSNEIFDNFVKRERLGTTGIGHGIAIPHARSKRVDYITGALIQFKRGMDFDAMDGKPVDIVFALLVPEESATTHLEILALLARHLSNPDFCLALRSAKSPQELYQNALNTLL